MKKILYFLAFLSVAVIFQSCEKEEYDESLLIGKWKPLSGTTRYFRYDANGSGVTWNPDEDQKESEGQKFNWKLVQTELKQRHHIEIIGEDIIIEIYTVTMLNETTLKYKNESKSYTFVKYD